MAQFHYIIYFDTADEGWHVDLENASAYMADGVVWDYAGLSEWTGVPDLEEEAYISAAGDIEWALNENLQTGIWPT